MTVRRVLILVAFLLVGIGLWYGITSIRSTILKLGSQSTKTVVVQDSSLLREVRELRARKPSIIERVVTREVKPDTVYVAGDTLTIQDRLEMPHGMVEVDKEGDRLTVTELDYNTGEVRKQRYTLPDPERDYILQAGGQPAALRVDRSFGFSLDLALNARLQWPLTGGQPRLQLAGPLEVQVGPGTVRPYVQTTGVLEETEAGLEAEVRL